MLDKKLLALLVCPLSKGPLVYREPAREGGTPELWSAAAGLAYPVRDGLPVLLEEQARLLEAGELQALQGK